MLHVLLRDLRQQIFGSISLSISQFLTLLSALFTAEYKAGNNFGYKLF